MMDDLRDYRFYEADLIHPNNQAHDYIFDKFVQSGFNAELRDFVSVWSQIGKSLAHRPLHGENSPAQQAFLNRLLVKLENLSERVDVSSELTEIRNRLEKCMQVNG
jgi:DNA repair ATPase RecN